MDFAALALVSAIVVPPQSPAAPLQTPGGPDTQASSPASDVAIRNQVHTVEGVFVTAVNNGVQQLAKKINELFPDVAIFAGAPRAHGYRVENYGWFFDVEMPELLPAQLDLAVQLRRPTALGPASSTRAVDPKTDPLSSPIFQDPSAEYRSIIKDSLIDALLDFGRVPLKPNEYLTIGARGADSPQAYAPPEGVTMVFIVSGDDLAAFRQDKITRDEAKKRIKIREERR